MGKYVTPALREIDVAGLEPDVELPRFRSPVTDGLLRRSAAAVDACRRAHARVKGRATRAYTGPLSAGAGAPL